MAGIKKSTKDTLDYLNKHPELGKALYWDDVYGKQAYSDVEHDFSHKGFESKAFSSYGWRSYTKNDSGVNARVEAQSNRQHDLRLMERALAHDKTVSLMKSGLRHNKNGSLSFVDPLAPLSNLLGKISNGAGNAIAAVGKTIGNVFSTKITAGVDERKHYASLAVANKMDKRQRRSNAFNALSRKHDNAVAYRRSERAKKKAHRREKDRIAFQRGYW